ncbi:MAG: PAS domain-containing protein, partial [Thermodesulfobacteriota bacterium]
MKESSKNPLNTERKRGRLKDKKRDSAQRLDDKEAQRRLASLMNILPGTFYRCQIDKKWTMEFLSPSCEKLTGYEPEELIENKKIAFGDIIHPQDLGSGWEKIQEAIKQKKPFQHTYRIITKEGRLKWVWEQGNAVYSPQGEPIALEGIITDVTDFKLNEEAIRQLVKENEIIANIGRIISSSLDIDKVYKV